MKEQLKNLKLHQQWRTGEIEGEIEEYPLTPKEVTSAIDYAIAACELSESSIREPFDISEYKFMDAISIVGAEVKNGFLIIHKNSGSWDSYDKDDAIAIAKALGVTREDL